MPVKTTTQYSVMVPNEPSQLARVTQILADAGINIGGIMATSVGSALWLRFLAKGHDELKRRLENKGLEVHESRVLRIDADPEHDLLDRVTATLAARGINLLSCYGHTAHGRSSWVLAVDRPEEAAAALGGLTTIPLAEEAGSLVAA